MTPTNRGHLFSPALVLEIPAQMLVGNSNISTKHAQMVTPVLNHTWKTKIRRSVLYSQQGKAARKGNKQRD
eukprot:1150474-Pelagomonas_calceolata.AAC.1